MSAPLIQGSGNPPLVPIDPVGASAIPLLLPLGLATVCGVMFLSGTSIITMNARKLEDVESNLLTKLLECQDEAKKREMEKSNLRNSLSECEKENSRLKNELEEAKRPEQRTIIICESDDGEIRCESPKTLKIESAIFGRTEPEAVVCPFTGTSLDNTNCRLDVRDQLSGSCDGETRCPIPTELQDFPGAADPCVGTYKYVEVTYTCS